jgi:hypothetical protein
MSTTFRIRLLGAAAAIGLAGAVALFTPAGAADLQPLLKALGIVSCASPGPCEEYDNSKTGAGLKGTSSKGPGLIGITHYNKTGATSGSAGVSGLDTATQTLNSGVLGTSTMGTGVSGTSTQYIGVTGFSTNGLGIFGAGSIGGVIGQVTGTSSSFTEPGVAGVDDTNSSTNIGVVAQSNKGIGLSAVSNNIAFQASGVYGGSITSTGPGLAVNAGELALGVQSANGLGIEVLQASGNVQAPLVLGSGVTGQPFVDAFEAFDNSGTLLMKLTDTGDISILGQIFTSGFCNSGCSTHGKEQRRVVSYTPTEAEPTREDTGIGQLVGGKAYVHLDPSFVNVIDASRSYVVFLTPEGDSRGLFVTSKTSGGFVVNENMGGTSTLSFDYRVVAKPYGVNAPRLPMITLPHQPTPKTVPRAIRVKLPPMIH